MSSRGGFFALVLVVASSAGCLSGGEDGEQDGAAVAADEGATVRELDVEIVARYCPLDYDNLQSDGVCLAYNGLIPGPTWVFPLDERVEITLHNRVAETLSTLNVGGKDLSDLAEARYSMHRHGISQDACSDGVAQPVGTEVCDSTVGPGESITYTFDTIFPGFWHYHDHAHTFSVGAARGPTVHVGAVDRGLWGSFIVLPPGQSTDRVFDLHLTDAGANSGLGLDRTTTASERFDLDIVGLGFHHRFYQVRLDDPDGQMVGEVIVGPGVSRGITVHAPQAGTYTWTAEGITAASPHDQLPSAPETYTGTITVTTGAASIQAPVPHGGQNGPASPSVPDQVFVIPFNQHESTVRGAATESMGLPLLEATVGEVLEFHIINNDLFPHVFHMHGHSWLDHDSGKMIDAEPLLPGDTHTFTVVAGLEDGHAGDWFYHCHVSYDSINAAMWGVLRVEE